MAVERPFVRFDMLRNGIGYVVQEKDNQPISDYSRDEGERDVKMIAKDLTEHTGIPMFPAPSPERANCAVEFMSGILRADKDGKPRIIKSFGEFPNTSHDTFRARLLLSVLPISEIKTLSVEKKNPGTGREEEWRRVAHSYGIRIVGEHELGHVQGLGHAVGEEDIMAPKARVHIAFERDLLSIPAGAMRYTDSAGEKLVLYADLLGDISQNKSRYLLRCLRALALAGKLEEVLERK